MHAGKYTGLMTMTALVLGLMLIAGCSMTNSTLETTSVAPATSADMPSGAPAGGFSLAAGDALGNSLFMDAETATVTSIARND